MLDKPTHRGTTSLSLPDPPILHEDRFFDPDPSIRRTARELYGEVRTLPLVCPHGHVDPRLLADDDPFPSPTALFIDPDHYVVRFLYAHGVPMESLGIRGRGNRESETDPRRVWQTFADHIHLFRGTTTGVWVEHGLHEVLAVRRRLTKETAQSIYDEICERLRSPEFHPRALFERFGIEVLATTDAAADPLAHHGRIRESGWSGRVIPTFRPDALFGIEEAGWADELRRLETACGFEISSHSEFLMALEDRRRHFRSMGATATDHAVVEPYTQELPASQVDALFRKALQGTVEPGDQRRFEGHMLMEMARMSTQDGMVMQLHPGSLRNHHLDLFQRYGPDRGADIPIATEYTRNLRPLLNAYGRDPRLTLILFTLDESTYSRELAPLASHYPAVRLGLPWWYHDSIEGLRRFLERTVETTGISKTVGFNDDARAFCSIPARHDLARRAQANWLARLVARHVLDLADAREMALELAYGLPRSAYRLDGP
jgi:glucuronate isomerase